MRRKEFTIEKETVEERMQALGVYHHEQCYFVHNLGLVLRMQKGPMEQGQNGVTQGQLQVILDHVQQAKGIG